MPGDVFVGLAGAFAVMLIVSLLVPVPWVILAAWLDSRATTKRIIAQARLQEAKNAAAALAKENPDV